MLRYYSSLSKTTSGLSHHPPLHIRSNPRRSSPCIPQAEDVHRETRRPVDPCQNPLLGNVLRSSSLCIHERNHQRIQIQLNKREQTPPRWLIQMTRNKVVLKIHVWIPKSPIIEWDHKKSDLGFFPCSKISGKFKQWLKNKWKPLFKLKFKSFEF